MFGATAITSQMTDMGQTSSQLQNAPATDQSMDDQSRSNRKKVKSRKRKRESAGVEQPLDPEKESARALLQMAGSGVPDSTVPYYGNDLAASQQLITESSPIRSPAVPNIGETALRSSEKRRSQRNGGKNGKRKQSGGIVFNYPSSEEGIEKPRYPQRLVTPFDQTDRSPRSPHRQTLSQSQHALDDVPSDDETAAFDKEFGNEATAPEPNLPNHDVFSFSQQPPDIPDQEGEMFPSYQLPTHVYTSPRAVGRLKKRKRDTPLAMDNADAEQLPVVNEAGQYILD